MRFVKTLEYEGNKMSLRGFLKIFFRNTRPGDLRPMTAVGKGSKIPVTENSAKAVPFTTWFDQRSNFLTDK